MRLRLRRIVAFHDPTLARLSQTEALKNWREIQACYSLHCAILQFVIYVADNKQHEMKNLHGYIYVDLYLMGSEDLWSGANASTFQRKLLSSGVRRSF